MLDSEDINEENFTSDIEEVSDSDKKGSAESFSPGSSIDFNIDGEELTLF